MKIKLCMAGLLLLVNSIVFATPATSEVQTYYKITGSSDRELRAQMNKLGPVDQGRHFDAKTSWHINWRYNWHYDGPNQTHCYVTSVQISDNIETILPSWTDEGSADSLLQNKWDAYLLNLTTHEQGHGTNGKRAADEIEKALLATPVQRDCNALKTELDKRAYDIIHKHNDWDLQYDTDTNHGKTQGAVFP